MATALIAWFRAPAPTTWTSTAPDWRTAPAIAPATEFGLDFVETLRVSIRAPSGACQARQRRWVRRFPARVLPRQPSGFAVFTRPTHCVTARASEGGHSPPPDANADGLSHRG